MRKKQTDLGNQILNGGSGKRKCSEKQATQESHSSVDNDREQVINIRYKDCHPPIEYDIRTPEFAIGSSDSTFDKRSILTAITDIPSNCNSIQNNVNSIMD
ncbi:hypothetical protein QN277_025429 [Acacia crassicarpa]|uniref:Uncharacterized protein n=1 Tax=Acacia crassicarpa TaxID=499986 RepID=A0AAE1MKX8_9FABA|nr:hypothetical protein QN277_025429 [Acacia crassicarpa]